VCHPFECIFGRARAQAADSSRLAGWNRWSDTPSVLPRVAKTVREVPSKEEIEAVLDSATRVHILDLVASEAFVVK